MNILINKINENLRGTDYSCKTISWNDVSRYNNEVTGLSCMGDNITDCKLTGKNGEQFYTIRSDNWNEKIGTVSADAVAVVVKNAEGVLCPITLRKYISDIGMTAAVDDKVSIRFQTTFLPLKPNSNNPNDNQNERNENDYEIIENRPKVEFCTEVYSYNTPDESNPRNLLVLATTQGVTLAKNKSVYQKLFLQDKDTSGKIVNRWLEAEQTDYKVGQEQVETDEQVKEAVARGKAASSVIGIQAMGQRFNALMTIQIPLKQAIKAKTRGGPIYLEEKYNCKAPYKAVPFSNFPNTSVASVGESLSFGTRGGGEPDRQGVSSAARISMGSVVDDTFKYVDVVNPEYHARDHNQHCTITVILYHVVEGGVPSIDDVRAAVEELDRLYSACKWSGKLAIKHEQNVVAGPKVHKFDPNLYDPSRTTFPVAN